MVFLEQQQEIQRVLNTIVPHKQGALHPLVIVMACL